MVELELYNKVCEVPDNAKTPITGGRLAGMTDINPMWRIKALTENFGPCGFGWYYEIKEKWIETVTNSQDVVCNVIINLYIKDPDSDEWSKPICGQGGSKLASIEKGKLYVNDESLKMATTDAISVACKCLGFGANVYWGSDNDKYVDKKRDNFAKDAGTSNSKASTPRQSASSIQQPDERKKLTDAISEHARAVGLSDTDVVNKYHINRSTPIDRLKEVLSDLQQQANGFVAVDEQPPWEE